MSQHEAKASGADKVLLSFLNATDQNKADQYLAELITVHARPLVRSIIRATVRFSADSNVGQAEDLEDIHSEVTMQLVVGLRRLREASTSGSAGSFRNYVAVTTYNCCYSYLRRKHPNRLKLKDRLRYILRHRQGLGIWEWREKKWLCGYVVWRDEGKDPADPRRLQFLRDNPPVLTVSGAVTPDSDLLTPLSVVFDQVGAPVEFDDLVAIMAELLGVNDRPTSLDSSDLDSCSFQETLFGRSAEHQAASETYMELAQLWSEIRELPVRQRKALLLGLSDRQGRDVITLFANARVASLREIADALAIDVERLTAMWNELPLQDSSIAELLGLTRQQVINLRKSARDRLHRRTIRGGKS